MAAVHTPYNLVGLQINGSRIYLPSERYLEDLGSHYIPLINSLSDGECEYQRQPEVPDEGTLLGNCFPRRGWIEAKCNSWAFRIVWPRGQAIMPAPSNEVPDSPGYMKAFQTWWGWGRGGDGDGEKGDVQSDLIPLETLAHLISHQE